VSRNFELLQKIELEREIRERESRRQLELGLNPIGCEPSARHGDDAQPRLPMDESARAELNKLVQHLFIQPGASRAVVFSAVESGDGCSWITARAATTLAARVTGSVCVVDANFHSPTLHRYFSIDNGHGLQHVPPHNESIKACAQRVLPSGNLWVITSASEQLGDEKWVSGFHQRAGEICREFDYVLFDAPPLALYSDAIAIAGAAADGIALVVHANCTTRDMAKKVTQDIEKANGRLLGVVLNRGGTAIPEQVYRWLQ